MPTKDERVEIGIDYGDSNQGNVRHVLLPARPDCLTLPADHKEARMRKEPLSALEWITDNNDPLSIVTHKVNNNTNHHRSGSFR
jgi:hypothetical protein